MLLFTNSPLPQILFASLAGMPFKWMSLSMPHCIPYQIQYGSLNAESERNELSVFPEDMHKNPPSLSIFSFAQVWRLLQSLWTFFARKGWIVETKMLE